MKIDGKRIADKILSRLKQKIEKLKKKNIYPKLAVILVGNDPSSHSYVKRKEIKAKEIGIEAEVQRLPKNISQDKLLNIIRQYDRNKEIHGIIIQQPLPKHINTSLTINAVSANKDIDGFLPNSKFEMPITMAVLEILEEIFMRVAAPRTVAKASDLRLLRGELRKWLKSQKIVIIGKGETGGKPIINMLKKLGIEPQIIDSKTMNYELLTKTADIIISAVGKQNVITKDTIKKGVILISIGLSRGKDGKMYGDYEESEIKNIASFYTPTPGGVGPVNIAMLLKNLVAATKTSVSH